MGQTEALHTESQGLFSLHVGKHVLESTVIHGVHVEFTPKSTSWAAPQPALKVLLQVSKMDGK